jgi:hypothetical protein
MTQKNRTLGWATPIGCIMLAGIALFIQSKRLSEANTAVALARTAVDKAMTDRKSAVAAESDHRYGAADASTAEELSFIDELRRQASHQGLEIKSLGASMVTSLDRTQSDAEDQKKLEGLKEVSTNITLAGDYFRLRSFLWSVTTQNRLCNVRALKWERTDTGNELSVTLARYIKVAAGGK